MPTPPDNSQRLEKQRVILAQILKEIQSPGAFRATCIGIAFPEMDNILTLLAALADTLEKE